MKALQRKWQFPHGKMARYLRHGASSQALPLAYVEDAKIREQLCILNANATPFAQLMLDLVFWVFQLQDHCNHVESG